MSSGEVALDISWVASWDDESRCGNRHVAADADQSTVAAMLVSDDRCYNCYFLVPRGRLGQRPLEVFLVLGPHTT